MTGQRGNVFTVLLGGVALSGALGYMMYQTMAGPIASMVRVTKATAAEAQMMALSRAVVVNASSDADADCDGDGFIEPAVWEAGAGPAGGGLLPSDMGLSVTDPWNTRYGYCVWDVGTVDDVDCGGPPQLRIPGSTTPAADANPATQTVFALISAGPDRSFTTTCNDYVNASTDVITTGGDDAVMRYTYREAQAVAGDLWKIKSGDPTAATIPMDIDVAGKAVESYGFTTADGGSITATGGIQLGRAPDAACGVAVNNDADVGLMRYTGVNVVQVTKESTGAFAADAVTASFGRPVTPGNTIIAAVSTIRNSTAADPGAPTVTGYTLAGSASNGCASGATNRRSTRIYYMKATSPTQTVEVTPAQSSKITIVAMEVAGLADNPLDKDVQGSSAAAATSTTTTATTALTQENELAVAALTYCDAGADVAFDPDDDWTQDTNAFEDDADTYAALSVVFRQTYTTTAVSHTWGHVATTLHTSPYAVATFKAMSADAPVVEYCDGTDWNPIGSGGGTAIPADDIETLADGTAEYTVQYKVGLGKNALVANVADGLRNTAIGESALKTNTTGDDNTAVGYASGDGITVTSGNTSMGATSLSAAAGSQENTALGASALADGGGAWNTAVGKGALANAGSTYGNTGVGAEALNAAGGGSGVYVVQASSVAFDAASSGSDLTVAFSTPPAAGNTVVLMLAHGNTAVTAANVSDDQGGTAGSYTLAATGGTTNRARIFYRPAISEPSGNFTVTVTKPANDQYTAQLLEVAGLGSNPVDRTGSNTPAVAATTTVTASAQNTQANVLAVAAVGAFSGANPTSFVLTSPGWTTAGTQDNGSGRVAASFGYKAASALETSSAAWSHMMWSAPALTSAAVIVTFKGATASGGTAIGSGSTAFGYQALRSNASGEMTAFGYQALRNNTTGVRNTALGAMALLSNTTGSDNSAGGFQSLYANTTGELNTAMGHQALYSNTTGSRNSGMGYKTLYSNTTGDDNTAAGALALYYNVSGSRNSAAGFEALKFNTANDNTAAGYQALKFNTTGTCNTATGYQALYANTTGSNNSAAGYFAMLQNTTGSENTAIGWKSLGGTATGGTYTASYNTAIGASALTAIRTGTYNTSAGFENMKALTTGNYNTSMGYQSMLAATSASGLTALGYATLASVTTVSGRNTAVGSRTLYSMTSGQKNAALGVAAMGCSDATAACAAGGASFADENTAVGYNAMIYNQNGDGNVAIGMNAIQGKALGATASYNTSIGKDSGINLTSGGYNTSFGDTSMWCNTTGSYITAFGVNSARGGGATTCTVSNNTSVGNNALGQNQTGVGNTTIGYNAHSGASSASYVTAIGDVALQAGSGDSNTAVGFSAAENYAAGGTGFSNNTAMGTYALPVGNASGAGNTAFGYQSLYYTSTGANNTAVGWQASNSTAASSNTTFIGYGATGPAASNGFYIGNGSTSSVGGAVALTLYSDRRLKKDIKDSDLALDFIMKLRPVSYHMKNGNGRLSYGFIAQEVEEALEGRKTNLVVANTDRMKTLMMRHDDLIAPIAAAIQQRQRLIERQQEEIDALRAEVDSLEKIADQP